MQSKYRSDIDGLRALAVLAVVGFHAFPSVIKGGFIGVDIFFVISGFLISTILLDGLEKKTFSFKNFYGKRIKRIFPALLIVLIFCFVFGWFALFPSEYQQLGKHIAGSAGFISNFLLWQESGYFDNATDTKPLLHLWSLGIEEQFYILWPLLLWAAWKKQFNLLLLIIIFTIISFLLNIKGINSDATATFYSPHTRFWELLCGSLLAWVTLYKPNESKSIAITTQFFRLPKIKRRFPCEFPAALHHMLSFLGFFFIVLGIYKLSKASHFPGFWALLPTFGTLLIIAAGAQAWINRIILSNRIMIGFGLISFPLYLWHWPLLSFARIMEGGTPSRTIRVAAIFLAVIFAWLTYTFVEKPIRFKQAFNRTKVILLMFLLFIIGYAGLFVYKHQGFSFRLKNFNHSNKLMSLIDNPLPPVESFDCKKRIKSFGNLHFDGGCALSKDLPPEIMFIGDSHTLHYQNAVWKYFTSNSVLMVVQTACLPFSGNFFLHGDCKAKYDTVLSFLETNTTVKKVYLSGYWAYLMTGGFAKAGDNWRSTKAIDEQKTQSFKENAKKFIASILKTNKEIIFLMDIPDLDFNINSCFKTRPIHLSQRQNCWLNFADYQNRVANYDQVIHEVLADFPQVKIYDPRPLFCKENKCVARDKSLPFYFNGDHLNHYGASMVIKDMLHKAAIG